MDVYRKKHCALACNKRLDRSIETLDSFLERGLAECSEMFPVPCDSYCIHSECLVAAVPLRWHGFSLLHGLSLGRSEYVRCDWLVVYTLGHRIMRLLAQTCQSSRSLNHGKVDTVFTCCAVNL